MMRDVSLRGQSGVSNELIVNKIQDFAWDDVLSEFVLHPNVLVRLRVATGSIFSSFELFGVSFFGPELGSST